jgi:hypothetical protein
VEDQALWNVEILFSEDYRTLQTVYVVNSLYIEELEKLRLAVPNETE